MFKILPGSPAQKILLNKSLWGALSAALLLILAFPPFEQGYLAWVALLPLLFVIFKASPAGAFKAGLVFAFVLNFYVNFYLNQVLFAFLSAPLALLTTLLIAFYTSLFYALFALSLNLVSRYKNPLLTALAAPTLWMLFEYSRSLGFMGYNVGYIGYTQWQYTGLLNLAATYGYWGLPFLIVLGQTIVFMVFTKRVRQKEVALLSFIFIFILALGLMLPALMEDPGTEKMLRACLIQGNSTTGQVLAGKDEVANTYFGLTEALNKNEADLVVWPETVIDINQGAENFHDPRLIKLAEKLGTDILYGARLTEEGSLYNIITFCAKENPGAPVYKKKRLVPFVEFFPAEKLLNRLLKLNLLLGNYTPGQEIILFETGDHKIAGVICFESYFGSHTRLFARQGADHLFILTNDGWFGASIGLEQHAQVAAIRAAEMGTGVTQVANSGLSISFDHKGRELLRSGKETQEVILLSLDLQTRTTLYKLWGDYFPLLWGLILSLFLLAKKYLKPLL